MPMNPDKQFFDEVKTKAIAYAQQHAHRAMIKTTSGGLTSEALIEQALMAAFIAGIKEGTAMSFNLINAELDKSSEGFGHHD
jgi:hypothetical protein